MRTTTRKALATVVTAAALTGAGFGAVGASAAPQAPATTQAPAQEQAAIPEIPVTIDPVAIANVITDAAKTADGRDGFVRNLSYQAYYNLGQQQYDVMVMNLSQGHDPSGLQGVVGYSDATYDGITYGVWIFESGTFVNEGDGGYINWAFFGVYDRPDNGGTVHFS